VYHEIKPDNTGRLHEDGCVSYRVLNPSDAYEHAKLNARRRAAECFADQMDDLWNDFKKTTVGVEPELSSELSFSIDEEGNIRPISTSRPLDTKAENSFLKC
jgi:hypothetical protein